MTFFQWMAEIRAIAREHKTPFNHDHDLWRFDFEAGLTPEDAWIAGIVSARFYAR